MMSIVCLGLLGCANEDYNVSKIDNQASIDASSVEDIEQNEITFPEKYTADYENISFDCEVDLPDDFSVTHSMQGSVNKKIYVDEAMVSELYLKDADILETHTWPGTDTIPDGYSYILSDGTNISTSDVFVYASPNKTYYSQTQVHREEYQEQYMNSQVSFASGEEAIEEIYIILEQLGYPVDSLKFYYYPLNANDLKNAEQEYIDAGLIIDGEEKTEWTTQDDAYFIYAYQTYQDLPILHESMSISYQFVKQAPDAAPIQAIYSANGLESLMVYNLYDISSTENHVSYLEFEEIVECVVNKYNNILSDSVFAVPVARLCQMVSYDKNQELIIKPVWYFEVIENEMTRSYMLVDAVTGNEIYLG